MIKIHGYRPGFTGLFLHREKNIQTPDPASAGNDVIFTVSFKTKGGAVTNLKIIGGVDGAQIFERTYASIAADKVRTDSFIWTATAGNYTVWFELDPAHTQDDSNYANNRIEKSITLGGGTSAGQPNLTAEINFGKEMCTDNVYKMISPRAINHEPGDSVECLMTQK